MFGWTTIETIISRLLATNIQEYEGGGIGIDDYLDYLLFVVLLGKSLNLGNLPDPNPNPDPDPGLW
jgi:hypothetical protein